MDVYKWLSFIVNLWQFNWKMWCTLIAWLICLFQLRHRHQLLLIRELLSHILHLTSFLCSQMYRQVLLSRRRRKGVSVLHCWLRVVMHRRHRDTQHQCSRQQWLNSLIHDHEAAQCLLTTLTVSITSHHQQRVCSPHLEADLHHAAED